MELKKKPPANFGENDLLAIPGIKSSSIPESNVGDSWLEARSYIARLGITSNYTSPIRAVLKAKRAGAVNDLREIFMSQLFPYVIRVSPSFQAIYYFAAKEYYPSQFAEIENGSIVDLLDCMTVDDLVAVLVLGYLRGGFQRHLKDDNEQRLFQKKLRTSLVVGRLIGGTYADTSPAEGMLIGGVLGIAFSMLALADVETFRKYRQKLKIENLNYDLKREFETWGCNHLQIAALLLQEFGFGRCMAEGMCSERRIFIEGSPESVRCWNVKELLCEILSNGKHVSQLTSTVDIIENSDWEKLLQDTQAAIEASENEMWIDMRKDSLSAEQLEQLLQIK